QWPLCLMVHAVLGLMARAMRNLTAGVRRARRRNRTSVTPGSPADLMPAGLAAADLGTAEPIDGNRNHVNCRHTRRSACRGSGRYWRRLLVKPAREPATPQPDACRYRR